MKSLPQHADERAPAIRNRNTNAKTAALPPEFRAIRDNPNLTQGEKINGAWDLLVQQRTPIILPPDIPEKEFDLREQRERTFYQARQDKNGKLRMVAVSPKSVD